MKPFKEHQKEKEKRNQGLYTNGKPNAKKRISVKKKVSKNQLTNDVLIETYYYRSASYWL